MVLEAIKKLGSTYQSEIAKETNLRDSTVNAILKKLEQAKIIKSSPHKDKDTGRLINKIILVMDAKNLDKIILHYKTAQSELKNTIAALQRPKKNK